MSKEAMKLALEALESYKGFIDDAHILEGQWHWIDGADNAQAALLEALAEQPTQQTLDKMAENARELGLDYEPSAGTRVSKVWWDGEKLMAEPIDPTTIYQEPAQQKPVAKDNSNYRFDQPGLDPLYTSPPAQRTWVGLTTQEVQEIHDTYHKRMGPQEFARAIEAKLREKNYGTR